MATFSGGDKLSARLAEMAKKLDSAASVSAGVHEGARYPDGTSVGMVASVQEFGSSSRGIPPRPFIRPAIASNSKKWGDVIARGLRSNDLDTGQVLGIVGEVMQGDIRQAITDVTSPPLKPQTVARKGFDKPLIDTAVMQRSVDYEVQG